MKKILLVASLMAIIFLISGCAISEYLTGVEEEKPYSLLTEKEAEELEEEVEEVEEEELEEEVEELDEEVEELDEEVEEESDAIVITVDENEMINLKPKAKDADEDTIDYTFSEPLDSEGKWQTTYGDAGEYLITVTASDGELETSRQVLLVVEKVNVAPVIEDVPKDITVDEGDILVLAPTATDPNGDDVELTIGDPVGEDGEWVIGYKEAGEYVVEVTASDGELETVEKVLVVVNKKNVAPVIENIGDMEVDEGDIVSIDPVVTDLNEDDVEVTISEPVGNNGVWETAFTDHGTYKVFVTADDGTVKTTEEITIVVNDVNVAPVIEDITLG
jgi:nitrogen fixation protein FixH